MPAGVFREIGRNRKSRIKSFQGTLSNGGTAMMTKASTGSLIVALATVAFLNAKASVLAQAVSGDTAGYVVNKQVGTPSGVAGVTAAGAPRIFASDSRNSNFGCGAPNLTLLKGVGLYSSLASSGKFAVQGHYRGASSLRRASPGQRGGYDPGPCLAQSNPWGPGCSDGCWQDYLQVYCYCPFEQNPQACQNQADQDLSRCVRCECFGICL